MRTPFYLASIIVVALLLVTARPAEAQLFKRLKDAVTNAAEDETKQQMDRMVRDGVQCVFNDLECIERAKAEGQTVVLTDAGGEPIVDEGGAPVSDPATAAEMVGEAPPAAAGPMAPGSDVWANYDFVPGEEALYVDDFTDDDTGDFPRRLEWLRGNMEIVEWEGRRLLRATGESQFAILLEDGVPEQFTLEFDVHDPSMSSGTVIVTEEAPQNARSRYKQAVFNFGSWRGSGIWRENEPLSTTDDKRMANEVVTARIMVDGAHAKLYINEKRISNAPRIELARGDRILFEIWGRAEDPIYLGNIRLAAGGRDLYDDLIESGRVATHGILFDVNSDRIRPESTPTLEEIGEMLADHADLRISIEGHTDSDGDDASNQALSEKRAAAVRNFLTATYGIDAGRLESTGVGEAQPVASNDTPEGKQQNRRVELVVL